MFAIILTYRNDLSSIDPYLDSHIEWLEKYYRQGIFLFSGRRQPRIGGVIIAHNVTRGTLDQILSEDPFYAHQIADYQIVEFRATKTRSDLAAFRED